MHKPVLDWMQKTLATLPPRQRVLEFGSYDINGSVRPLFGTTAYVGMDVRPGPGVDVVGNAATYQPKVSPDTVVCCEVLEHTPEAAAIVANAYKVLEPGGVLLLTVAMTGRVPHSQIDGMQVRKGEFYANVSPVDLKGWLSEFVNVVTEEHTDRGDLYAIAWKPKAKPKAEPEEKAIVSPENKMLRPPKRKLPSAHQQGNEDK